MDPITQLNTAMVTDMRLPGFIRLMLDISGGDTTILEHYASEALKNGLQTLPKDPAINSTNPKSIGIETSIDLKNAMFALASYLSFHINNEALANILEPLNLPETHGLSFADLHLNIATLVFTLADFPMKEPEEKLKVLFAFKANPELFSILRQTIKESLATPYESNYPDHEDYDHETVRRNEQFQETFEEALDHTLESEVFGSIHEKFYSPAEAHQLVQQEIEKNPSVAAPLSKIISNSAPNPAAIQRILEKHILGPVHLAVFDSDFTPELTSELRLATDAHNAGISMTDNEVLALYLSGKFKIDKLVLQLKNTPYKNVDNITALDPDVDNLIKLAAIKKPQELSAGQKLAIQTTFEAQPSLFGYLLKLLAQQ